MSSEGPDRHQHVLAILAIATAAIGVGLFGGGLKLTGPVEGFSGFFGIFDNL